MWTVHERRILFVEAREGRARQLAQWVGQVHAWIADSDMWDTNGVGKTSDISFGMDMECLSEEEWSNLARCQRTNRVEAD